MRINMNLQKKHYYLIGIWFIINLIQAAITGLHWDESYYWMYSQTPAWGYFDHPPMVAFFIRAGYFIFQNELGVRLMFVVVSTITFAIVLNELNERKDFFFLVIFILSFPLIHTHIAGFIAIPDIPLVLFTMLFLILYRKFIIRPGVGLSVLLALCLAAMIYSKYHAFLIIGFTVLSNLKLLRNKYFWLTALLTLVFLAPHIWWQIDNGLPTFKYHLISRTKPLRMKYFYNHIMNQVLMAGPLTGVLVIWKFTKVKIQDQFSRTLVFNIIGFFFIFVLLSFKNRIEAHWTAAVIPMLMMLTYPMIKEDKKAKRWFTRLALPIVVLMILARIYLSVDAIPNFGDIKITFYRREAVAKEIKQLAQGKKVGFFNNYAAASNYTFYTGDTAILLSTPQYRYCQYDLWNEEKYAHGEPVFAVTPGRMNTTNQREWITGEESGTLNIEEFQPLTGIILSHNQISQQNNKLLVKVTLSNKTSSTVYTDHVSQPVLVVMQEGKEITATLLKYADKSAIKPGEHAIITIQVPVTLFDEDKPFVIYTRSKENIRGELLAINPE
ncbi:MAG TPA: glycosyltransferase family 39 protein [Mariniphaga sp.]|nr:glycosyltransferase family 39 protein [Mariniphaga sp.]